MLSVEKRVLATSNPLCYLCNNTGLTLYRDLIDRHFGVAGSWNILHCPTCQLQWIDPKPLDTEFSKIYQDYYTHRESQRRSRLIEYTVNLVRRKVSSIELGYSDYQPLSYLERFLARLLELIPGVHDSAIVDAMNVRREWGKRLLDVGCGNGEFLRNMRNLGWIVEGTELDPTAALQARSLGLSVQIGPLEELHYSSQSFDVVTLSHVIEHVSDPISLLRECYRILRPLGYLVVTTPNNLSLGHRIFTSNWRGLEPPRHIFIFSPKSLEIITKKAGFQTTLLRTSARMASSIYHSSLRGTILDRSVLFSLAIKIQKYLFKIMESFLILNEPTMGEEIFYIGRRCGHD